VYRIKVEILIPLNYNDNRTIEGKKLGKTYNELFVQFGGVSISDFVVSGMWRKTGPNNDDEDTKKKYYDKNKTYWVVCDDNYDTYYFFKDYKEKLKERFEQEDMMIIYTYVYYL
jgi:hypothetical protein